MKKALIVYGGWPGHEPEQCAQVVRDMLLRHGFEVQVENQTAVFAAANLDRLDLIVPIITRSTITKPECDKLTAAVRAGVGLAGFHGGMCDAFRDAVDYQFMTGGQWGRTPATSSTSASISPSRTTR